MKATDYIKDKINSLVEHFPEIKLSYEFDDFAKSHIIEVLPSKFFKENLKYSKFETELILDFISQFPDEEIVFITENDLIKITNPIYVKEGYGYSNEIISWNNDFWSNDFIMEFNFSFNAFSSSIINSVDLLSDSLELLESKKIILEPIKEKPVEIEKDTNDFTFAA